MIHFFLSANGQFNPNILVTDINHWLARLLLRLPIRIGYAEAMWFGDELSWLHVYARNPYARLFAERARAERERMAEHERVNDAIEALERDLFGL